MDSDSENDKPLSTATEGSYNWICPVVFIAFHCGI